MNKDCQLIFEAYSQYKTIFKAGDLIHTKPVLKSFDTMKLGNLITNIIKQNEDGDYYVKLKNRFYYITDDHIDIDKSKELNSKFKPEDRPEAANLLDI